MATFDYGASKETAERLLQFFGQTATLKQVAQGGVEYAPTIDETSTSIIVVDLQRQVRDPANSSVHKSTRTLFVSTSAGVTPAKEDTVVLGDGEHEITEVRPLSPGGTVLLWEVDLAA